MTSQTQTFRSLHEGPGVLVLANCWDAASARLIESLGAPALATTSAGVAWALGLPDGDRVPLDRLMPAVRAITRVIKVPLSVDIENGYSEDPTTVGQLVAALADAGAVGINLEDGSGTADLLARKIEAVKRAALNAGVDVFVNARTDVYLHGLVAEPERMAETLSRASRFRNAGADGIFVPKVVDPAEIQTLALAVGLPLNVLAWPQLPAARELAALGVRRLSAGSALAQSALNCVATAAAAFLESGSSEVLGSRELGYAKLNALFPKL
jgi:2-methylisocitrate lyase-like PEP mutase family enzyme